MTLPSRKRVLLAATAPYNTCHPCVLGAFTSMLGAECYRSCDNNMPNGRGT